MLFIHITELRDVYLMFLLKHVFYVVEIGIYIYSFYSDVVECLPLDPAAKVRFPPWAVGIFCYVWHLVVSIFGPGFVFWASGGNVTEITVWFRADSGTNLFKAGKYVVGIGIYNTLLLPCARSRLI